MIKLILKPKLKILAEEMEFILDMVVIPEIMVDILEADIVIMWEVALILEILQIFL